MKAMNEKTMTDGFRFFCLLALFFFFTFFVHDFVFTAHDEQVVERVHAHALEHPRNGAFSPLRFIGTAGSAAARSWHAWHRKGRRWKGGQGVGIEQVIVLVRVRSW